MKTIGIIGGLSPESTANYYKYLNDEVRQRLGGHHSAKIILVSVDFANFCELNIQSEWREQSELLCQAAKQLEDAGADFIILATNTMHRLADDIIATVRIPFLHLADLTAQAVVGKQINSIGFLGTIYTMELDFFANKLRQYDLTVLLPKEKDKQVINEIIYDELTKGIVRDNSKQEFTRVISELRARGAEGIVLGCTEIAMAVDRQQSPIGLFDTTEIHVQGAVNFALTPAV